MFPMDTRILILDDMMTMRKIVMKTLKEIGFTNIVEGADGKVGFEILKSASPPIQLVISDWNMPVFTGLELLKAVRADAALSKVPFVLLTAEAEAHQVQEAVKAGVTNYIVKPFSAETLKQKLQVAYERVSKK